MNYILNYCFQINVQSHIPNKIYVVKETAQGVVCDGNWDDGGCDGGGDGGGGDGD